MTNDATADLRKVRAAQLVAADIPPSVVGWIAHRTASSRAVALLDLVTELSDEPKWLAAAGYERGTLSTDPDDVRRAATQLTEAVATGAVPAPYQLLLVDLLIQLRDDDRIAELLASGKLRGITPLARQMLDADLANPFRTPGLPEREWLDTIRPLFGDAAPVELAPESGNRDHEPLDRLAARAEPGTAHGALVSVVVSSYRPGPGLETAVRSMLAQTWSDLEILVIDDASGPEFSEVYRHIESLDERVQVLRQEQNGGTYVARNRAIDVARGTYVTFQDADDWSHPERIERQVAALERDPLVHAVRTQALRTVGSLVFSRQGSSVRAPAAASLMFRRDQVWPVLGGYDVVRKAADTEFHERISAALPGYSVDLDEPLMWVRLGEGSLSRNEFRAKWRHSARLLYRSAYMHWHEQIRLGASPRMDREVRRFPAPRRFRHDQGATHDEFDLIVLGDWRGDGNTARDAGEWIRLLASDGVRIALTHVEGLNFDGRRPSALMASVQEMVAAGIIEMIPWDAPVAAKALVAVDPETLEYLPNTDSGARATSIVVLLDGAPRDAALIEGIEAIVKERWESRLIWSPRGAPTHDSFAPTAEVLNQHFPPVLPREARHPLHRTGPVVVVAPIGIDPEVLDETATVATALAESGLDVRVRIAAGLRLAIRTRVGILSPSILWAAPTSGAAAGELAVATDLVIVGSQVGIDFERLMDDARVWGVHTHVRVAGEGDAEEDADSELIERIRAEDRSAPVSMHDPQARQSAEAAVRTWYQAVSTLA